MSPTPANAPAFDHPPSASARQASRFVLWFNRTVDAGRSGLICRLGLVGGLTAVPGIDPRTMAACLAAFLVACMVGKACRAPAYRCLVAMHPPSQRDINRLELLLFEDPRWLPVVARWIATAGALQERHTRWLFARIHPGEGSYLDRCLAYNGTYQRLVGENYLDHLAKGELAAQIRAIQLGRDTPVCLAPSRLTSRL